MKAHLINFEAPAASLKKDEVVGIEDVAGKIRHVYGCVQDVSTKVFGPYVTIYLGMVSV